MWPGWGWSQLGLTRGQGARRSAQFLLHMLLNEEDSPEFKGLKSDYTVIGQLQMSKAPWCPYRACGWIIPLMRLLGHIEKQIFPKSEGKDTPEVAGLWQASKSNVNDYFKQKRKDTPGFQKH